MLLLNGIRRRLRLRRVAIPRGLYQPVRGLHHGVSGSRLSPLEKFQPLGDPPDPCGEDQAVEEGEDPCTEDYKGEKDDESQASIPNRSGSLPRGLPWSYWSR